MSAPPEGLRPADGWPAPIATILLAAWLGAALYFTVTVTRAAFAVLPSRAMAGALVGRTLPVLFDTGMLVGVLLIVLALRAPAGAIPRSVPIGGIVIAVLTAAARFIILVRIDRLRGSLPAAIDTLSASDPARRAFGQLHALSVGALGLAMLAGIVVIVVLAHTLSVAAHD